MNNRGQIFSVYLLILTIVMCFTVGILYLSMQDKAENSLVSPKTVFEFRDEVTSYEILERKLILESLKDFDDMDDPIFTEKLRTRFLEGLYRSPEMKKLLFHNISREKEVRENEKEYLNSLYSVSKDSDKVIFERGSVEKSLKLRAKKVIEINFPVEFSYRFEKKYLISFQDNKFVLEDS